MNNTQFWGGGSGLTEGDSTLYNMIDMQGSEIMAGIFKNVPNMRAEAHRYFLLRVMKDGGWRAATG